MGVTGDPFQPHWLSMTGQGADQAYNHDPINGIGQVEGNYVYGLTPPGMVENIWNGAVSMVHGDPGPAGQIFGGTVFVLGVTTVICPPAVPTMGGPAEPTGGPVGDGPSGGAPTTQNPLGYPTGHGFRTGPDSTPPPSTGGYGPGGAGPNVFPPSPPPNWPGWTFRQTPEGWIGEPIPGFQQPPFGPNNPIGPPLPGD